VDAFFCQVDAEMQKENMDIVCDLQKAKLGKTKRVEKPIPRPRETKEESNEYLPIFFVVAVLLQQNLGEEIFFFQLSSRHSEKLAVRKSEGEPRLPNKQSCNRSASPPLDTNPTAALHKDNVSKAPDTTRNSAS
jgi:hypothetical protein